MIRCHSFLYERLEVLKSKEEENTSSLITSWLIGHHSVDSEENETNFVINCIKCDENEENRMKIVKQTVLPGGMEIVGFSIDEKKKDQMASIASKARKWLPLPTKLVILSHDFGNDSVDFYLMDENGKTDVVEATKTEKMDNLILFRVEMTISMHLFSNSGNFQKNLQDQVKYWKDKFGSSVLITKSRKEISTSSSECVDTLISKESALSYADVPLVECSLLLKQSTSSPTKAPVLSFSSGDVSITPYQIDILCYIAKECPLENAYSIILGTISKQIDCMTTIHEETFNGRISAHHFLPSKFPHCITTLYPILPDKIEENYLTGMRKIIHQQLLLPMDRPLLRVTNALDFNIKLSTSKNKRIRDVHKRIQLSDPLPGGRQYLVDGSYDYYHYMQDKFNDKGWGCAYRSCQTICSWMKLQDYTSLEVPSIPEIQKILVDMGDKPRQFAGSSNWIGAIEISLVLDKLYGVTSNILHVSSGWDLAGKGRELQYHFQTQGTPVMIGGGVLAYTLLGIDFNESTGDIRFLILDPHYTGAEDLKTIKDKGWCGWKDVKLFKKDSFYNLCLPQRLRAIQNQHSMSFTD